MTKILRNDRSLDGMLHLPVALQPAICDKGRARTPDIGSPA